MTEPTQTPNDPAADPAAAPAAAGDAGGAFAAVANAEAAAAAAPTPIHERIPEKYRVAKEDGTFDLEASAAKLIDAHGHLEKRLGAGDAPPKDPDSYEPKTERFDINELKDDEQYKGWLKGAHAKGMTNDQVGYVLDSFADRLAEIAGPPPMSNEDFRVAVEPHFAGLGGYEAGLKYGVAAVRAFVPDVTAEELASLPNHPLIARVLAAVGKEVGEDTPIRPDSPAVADWEGEVAKLKASEAYNQANHPEHKQAIARMEELYARRYGKAPQKLGASAVIKT